MAPDGGVGGGEDGRGGVWATGCIIRRRQIDGSTEGAGGGGKVHLRRHRLRAAQQLVRP